MNFLMLYPLSSQCFLSHITQPTRIKDPNKTLIDIFSHTLTKKTISGNLTATISNHLPQFIILPNTSCNPPSKRDWSNVVQENFMLKHFPVDWNFIINKDHKDLDLSFNYF